MVVGAKWPCTVAGLVFHTDCCVSQTVGALCSRRSVRAACGRSDFTRNLGSEYSIVFSFQCSFTHSVIQAFMHRRLCMREALTLQLSLASNSTFPLFPPEYWDCRQLGPRPGCLLP